jgi:DNA recombination protein RmuC
MELPIAGAVVAALCAALAYFLGRRGGDAPWQALDAVSRSLGQLQSELTQMARSQDELRRDVQQSRETSLRQIADATLGLKGEIGVAQRALAEVKALEQGRARQMDQAADALRRLEAVVAGSATRGVAGENILARALTQLPPDLLEINVAFGGKIVEYALRLPGGRLLPIDSKWTSVPVLERMAETVDAQERRKLLDHVARDVRMRAREMAKYLDPERTLSIAVLAVPDAVYEAAPEVHAEAYRLGVLVVPYSLALPYVLALYRLSLRFGATVDGDQMAERLRALDHALRRVGEEAESRLSRGLVQAQNARDAIREHVLEAQGISRRLLRDTEALEGAPSEPRFAPQPLATAVGERD